MRESKEDFMSKDTKMLKLFNFGNMHGYPELQNAANDVALKIH